jgi:hypothetical protein
LKSEEIDEFHGLIFGDEMSRPGYPSASGLEIRKIERG